MLFKHKNLCQENQHLTTSPDSHIYWRKHFDKIPLYFRIMLILKLIIKKKILVSETEQLKFINKSQYLMDIIMIQT